MPRRAPLGDDTALIFNASGDKAEVHQWHFYRCDAVWHDSSRAPHICGQPYLKLGE
jgi:hypothetical protein